MCVYTYVHISIYVHIYISCMHAWMNGRLDGWTHGSIDACMMHVCMFAFLRASMYAGTLDDCCVHLQTHTHMVSPTCCLHDGPTACQSASKPARTYTQVTWRLGPEPPCNDNMPYPRALFYLLRPLYEGPKLHLCKDSARQEARA